MPVLICRRVTFYSQGDETAFFSWLEGIKTVRKIVGSGDAILLHVPRRISDKGLREILAVFHRYRIDMKQLAQFESATNRAWFSDRQMNSHMNVYPRTSVALQRR